MVRCMFLIYKNSMICKPSVYYYVWPNDFVPKKSFSIVKVIRCDKTEFSRFAGIHILYSILNVLTLPKQY